MISPFLGEEFAAAYNDAKIVVLPVPFDGTSTYGKGADKGPAALLAASQHVEVYDIETKTQVHEQGICTLDPLAVSQKDDPEKVVNTIERTCDGHIAAGKFIVMLGGEHSISTGLARALYKKYPNMSVLHFDAHGDTREEYEGSKYNHACVIARIRELGVPIVQVGIRSIDKEEVASRKENQHVYYAHEIHDNDTWMNDATSKLTDTVFITFDLDVFDPSIMPATGTPEPGGLLWYQTLTFLQKVISEKQVIGFDVVELAPMKDTPAPNFLAAKLVHRMLSMIFAQKK